MMIEKLEWDSNFFGIQIGRITVHNAEDFKPTELKQKTIDEKYELVYVIKYNEMFNWNVVKNANIELFDIMIKMSMAFNKSDFKGQNFDFKSHLSECDLKAAYEIAEATSIVSRFNKEPKIGQQKTKELYRKWIDNALNHIHSDGIFINSGHGSINGIHLIRTDYEKEIGYFTLTGVHPSQKRKGIGRDLWKQSFAYWAKNADIKEIHSPFSFQNQESFNFHIKMGFEKIEEIKYIYHFRNNVL